MLRRFNSLIKGPKAQISSDEESTENVSLRPARSVDSTLFAAVSPLEQVARRSEAGQTSSLSVTIPNGSSPQQGEERGPRAFAMGCVPEERSFKEGYEQGIASPVTPLEQYEPGEKPSDFHSVDLNGGATNAQEGNVQTPDQSEESACPTRREVSTQTSQFGFVSGPAQRQIELPRISRTSSDAVVASDSHSQSDCNHAVVDIPDAQAGSAVDLESLRKSVGTCGPGRTISSWSTDSAAEHCRICQQHSEEPLIDLGCLCRGEMAKSHKSCIEMWFKNKGTNKCEVCQNVAANIPAPATSPVAHFWVWRLGGPYAAGQTQASQAGVRRVGFQSGLVVNRPVLLMIIKKHPFIPIMWVALLAFMSYLFVDAINTSTIGYAAMPIGFLFGVLVVLGLGTAVRLILECWHESSVERSIRQMEMDAEPPQSVEEPTTQNRPPPPLPV